MSKFDLGRALKGEPVVLRNGEKAYVRHMEQGFFKSAHLLYGYTSKGDAALNWLKSGRYYGPTAYPGFDIVGMWVEPLVFEYWHLLSEDIKYLAKNRNGSWQGHLEKPILYRNHWRGGEWQSATILSPTLFPDCDWKNSLIERPENE